MPILQASESYVVELAEELANNHSRFSSFAWFRRSELADPENWAIVYTSNRDSGLLEESNAAFIEAELSQFTEDESEDPNIVYESHNHWAVGHVDGFSIRVYRPDGTITPAFRAYAAIQEALDDYPILDEDDYSQREHDATIENVETEGGYVARKLDYTLPDEWVGDVASWLYDNEPGELENRDDQGGYPSEDAIIRAFDALGYPCES